MLRMKYERLRRGWNQTTLGYHATMSVADVSRIECGRLRPYATQLVKLATALGVSGDELMQEVEASAVTTPRLTVGPSQEPAA